ncbi:MAG: hypothetical protein KC940_19450 [Candidatus Omnitrophica bacterium]|nr:hypothetical protein [Candidatus Omnitrophota bacterium]MCA9432699.1 hypothetical protein [Candidatus Omnitrophota bacterium]MCA9436038.1 hypothetical protein [Candidatus Omnitrophota bacterium]MCA9442991.1 hypothetical protein [Candidatus Omnitrophota bacterium]MCB9767544.1 hypothetical protein [Candidatus Omnitrophota bacterium]
MTKPYRLILTLASLTLAVGLQAQGLVSGSMNYGGTVVDATGDPLPDGNYDLAFSIYSQAAGGMPVWGPQEFDGQPGTGHQPLVAVVGGRFSVLLGPIDTSGDPLSSAFNGTSTGTDSRYIEVIVQGTALAPRQPILATPYALSAQGMIPIGSIIAHHLDLSSAADLARITSSGFALCNGTTAASQGVADPVITGALPNLNVGDGIGRFLRGTTGTTGAEQDDQIQGHFHALPNHTHTASSPPHNHTMTQTDHIHEITTGEGSAGSRNRAADADSSSTPQEASTNGESASVTINSSAVTINNTDSATVSIQDPTTGSHGTVRVGDETRPKSMMVVWIMRVR